MPLPSPFHPTPRTLLGPGPSDIHPRILAAMSIPTIGHLDPQFLACMDEIQAMLRQVFRTENRLTIPISGTGSAGMEAALVNVIEPGDRVVIARHGVFGARMADCAARLGCELVEVEVPFGEAIPPDRVKAAIAGKPTKLVGIVHAETSTGVLQPIPEIAALAHDVDALMLMDCVTSLGGVSVEIDNWGVDLAFSGTQKCLGCPPGLAPLTFGERAVAALENRKSTVPSWYLDLTMLLKYWGGERVYHHTAPINMLYALRESLIILLEEGLENAFARHLLNHKALLAGIRGMGLDTPVAEEYLLPPLNAISIPEGIDDVTVRKALLNEYNIEVGGGLGALAGKIWRVGLMGYSSRRSNVMLFLGALESILAKLGANIEVGAALPAAEGVYAAG